MDAGQEEKYREKLKANDENRTEKENIQENVL